MNWWQSAIIGIVEGVTEFLPVSSTAHILLAERILGLDQSEGSKAFDVVIQFGAVLAVAGVFAPRIRLMGKGLVRGDPDGLRLIRSLVTALIPAIIFGLLLNKWIKANLFNLWTASIGWAVGGVVLIVGGPWWNRWDLTARKSVDEMSLRDAALIGLMQCLGMWPGISRSLVTILGGLLVGLNLAGALEFSFLLGGVTLLAAATYDLAKHHQDMLAIASPATLAVGGLAAMIAAFVTVRWMLGSLTKLGLAPFGVYRVALAIAVTAALGMGLL